MKSIFLIGGRGVGKTSVGTLLASNLGADFYDSDEMICARAGCSVSEITNKDGWPEFRRLERKVLAECANVEGAVIATGGGAVLHHGLWEEIRQYGIIVWLTAPVNVLIARVNRDTANRENRPSLTGGEVAEEFAAIIREREPLYEQFAHHVIDTCSLDRTGIVADIVNVIRCDAKIS